MVRGATLGARGRFSRLATADYAIVRVSAPGRAWSPRLHGSAGVALSTTPLRMDGFALRPRCRFARAPRGGIAFVLLAACAALGAPPPAEYTLRTWTTDNGLPHNTVGRMLQDDVGFLWFGTVGGLARFDGREFFEARVPAEHRQRGFNIRAFVEESPGTLAVLSTSARILRYSRGTWSVHPVTALLDQRQETPVDLQKGADGTLWICTHTGRLVRCLANRTEVLEGIDATTRFRRMSFATDGAGKTWVGSDSLLACVEPAGLRRHEQTPREPLFIASGHDGRVWVCTERRLQRIDHGRLVMEAEPTPWQGEFGGVRQIFEDTRGVLWIVSSRQGLTRYVNGSFEHVALPYPSFTFIAEDREGNIWAGTDGHGIVQLHDKAYRILNSSGGLLHELVSSIDEDSQGQVWLANRTGGVAFIDPAGALQSAAAFPALRIYANVVQVDAHDGVWFGGGQSGLYRLPAGQRTAPLRLPVPKADLHLLFRSRNGDMWFAAEYGDVGYYRGDEPHLLDDGGQMSSRTIRSIAEDSQGAIWLGDQNGALLRWDGKQFEHFDRSRGLPAAPINALHADRAGGLWIGTAEGLVLKDESGFHILTQANGLADDIILHLVEDDEERLWFASRRGIFYAAKADLLATAHGRAERITSHAFGRNEGLSGFSALANYSPAAVKTHDGRLWFATAQGAVAIDPSRLAEDLPPPPVLIDEVLVDGARVPAGAPIRVPSGQHRVEFRFVALSYTAPEAVILRHQLDGVDQHWVDTGSDRKASYTRLPPDTYRLRVIACNSAGRWNTTGASLTLTVVPAWWETLTFRVLAAVLLTAATALIARKIAQRRFQQRLQRLERENALEKERARIARDLHDDLGASLTEVGLLADSLVEAAPSELAPQLSGLAWRTRRLATDLSGIIWTMNASNTTLDRLAGFLRRYAERLFRYTGTRCLVTGVESIPAIPLPPDPQHQLLAVAKEALNNTLKHARATEACIDLRYAQGCFELSIRDNGIGFTLDPATAASGNGLRNMRSRLTELGGTFEIVSSPGAGTRVTCRVPCAAKAAIS